MSRSVTPASNAVPKGMDARAPAPPAAPSSRPRADFYARVVAQLMRLLAQMAVR